MSIGVWARARLKSVAQRRGETVTIRQFSRLSGSDPQPSPPTISGNLVVAANALAGDSSVTIRATMLVGRLVAGDILTISGTQYTITSDATASLGQVVASVSPVLAADANEGDSVSAKWIADTIVRVMVLQQPSSGVPNAPETQRSLTVSIPAISLTRQPYFGDLIIRGSYPFAVIDSSPNQVGEDIVSYIVRAK